MTLLDYIPQRASAPSYMFIIGSNLQVFKGIKWHEEAKLIAEGLLYDDWSLLAERYLLLDSKPLRLDFYQKDHLRRRKCSVIKKSRRIGFTTIDHGIKRTLRSQFIPVPCHMVSLTQKHTETSMHLHNTFYEQIPTRIRAKRVLDRVNEKHYVLLGDKKGSHLKSEVHAHASSSESVRGLAGDVVIDELAFYKHATADKILKTVTPLLGTTYTHYDDTERNYEIVLISTHNGELTLFNDVCIGKHEFGRKAELVSLPWTVCPRVCQNIHNIAEGQTVHEYLEEMCCIPVSDKDTPFPPQLYDPLLADIEFDQIGIRVDRDIAGNIVPFDRTKYDFISVFWDYASFRSETCGVGLGVRGYNITPVLYFRMAPENYGGTIDEDEICRMMDVTARVLRPDWLGYDATGVGEYLSKVLFDPAFGFKENRRPRTEIYPYAGAAEPVQMSSEFKSSGVTKLKVAMRQKFFTDLPLDREFQRQLRMFKRSVTPAGNIQYRADGKGRRKEALDDIVIAFIGACYPLHIESQPIIVDTKVKDIVEMNIYEPILGSKDIFSGTTRSIFN